MQLKLHDLEEALSTITAVAIAAALPILGGCSEEGGTGIFVAAVAAGSGGGAGAGAGGGGDHGSGEGASGCGDVFGDLVHILRDGVTGQPILAKRWIEYPQDTYDWGYCPIPVDALGVELPLVDLSCDAADPLAVVEVDYFGRLSGGRTKERNQRMHFDEVIMGIKEAEQVRQDVAGRLRLGTECGVDGAGKVRCGVWRTVDSPMENMALYARLMRYGHIQTDPAEVDVWAHGDPAQGPTYHPALGPADYSKFGGGVMHLLPGAADWLTRATTCFSGEALQPACAAPKVLQNRDLIRASSFLGAAAGKEGMITVDLVQYMNRILAITEDTAASVATRRTLPALIRDCGDDPEAPLPPALCTIRPATPDLPWPASERFVAFDRVDYVRAAWRDKSLPLIVPMSGGTFIRQVTHIMGWLDFSNGPAPGAVTDIDGFVLATSDALRTNQLIHEYAVPEALGWDFE